MTKIRSVDDTSNNEIRSVDDSDSSSSMSDNTDFIGKTLKNLPGTSSALGFAQGFANIPYGIANLSAWGANHLTDSIAGSGNKYEIPQASVNKLKFNFAPENAYSTLGNLASFGVGSGLTKGAGEIPKAAEYSSQFMKLPVISKAIDYAHNVLNKYPTLSKVAGNSLLGGIYSPDNPMTGIALGGAATALPYAISSTVPYINSTMSAIRNLPNAISKINPKEVAKSVQESHDILDNQASNLFQEVGNELKNRGGLSNIIPLNKSIIDKISKMLPETDANKALIQKARTGDYQELRKLQSDLFHRSNQRLSSDFQADRDQGEVMSDLRNKINQSISDHLKNSGHNDLNDKLEKAKEIYKNLKDTYFGEHTPKAIGKLVNPKIREVPHNLMKVLSKDSIPMEKVRQANPLAAKNVELWHNKNNAIKHLKYLGLGSAAAAGGGAASYSYNKAKNILTS